MLTMNLAIRVALAFFLFALASCETASAWEEGTPYRCRVRTASADISCKVAGDGEVSDCRVISETPSDCGIGAAALEASVGARLGPRRDGGRDDEPSEVIFTVRFDRPRAS